MSIISVNFILLKQMDICIYGNIFRSVAVVVPFKNIFVRLFFSFLILTGRISRPEREL